MNHGDEIDNQIQLTAFRVGNEEYVVDILRVREVIRLVPITAVQRGPKYVEGVIHLRGAVIPVVDMRRRFGLPVLEEPGRRMMILGVDQRILAIIVDEVTEVVRVPRSSLLPAPGMLGEEQAPFFMGVCMYNSRQLILLSMRSILNFSRDIDVNVEMLRGLS